MVKKLCLTIAWITLGICTAIAQPEYKMSDRLVNDCKGKLLDSEENKVEAGTYGHNENYTFTICPKDVESITLFFKSFCTEKQLDVLRVFDGPDTLSPLLGAFSGTNRPPSVTSTGCLTLNFKSDASVTCDGWEANWTSEVKEPDTPQIAPLTPICSTSTITLNLSHKVHCDSVYAEAFEFSGPVTAAVNPQALNCQDDSTTTIRLNLNPGLNRNGTYNLIFTTYYVDECDSIWTLYSTASFKINDCPLQVDPIADPDTICPGDCAQITAVASGGDPSSYNYTWSHNLPGNETVRVCPASTTTYSVTVDDATNAPPVSAQIVITVLPPPQVPENMTFCQSDPFLELKGSPGGGYWQGNGILDPVRGFFHPDSAGGGTHTVTYFGPNGCYNSTIITIEPIDAGPDEAACPGSAPFYVSDFYPAGGTWSGANIQPDGLFDPATSGAYTVSYSVNSCTDTKTIYVDNISLQPVDSICRINSTITLNFSPPGGRWRGPGITDSLNGRFTPRTAGSGLKQLTYYLHGCSSFINVYVKEINAGNDQIICPLLPPVTLSGMPPGGTWSGKGITDPANGTFDPEIGNNGNNYDDTLTYTANGCSDTKIIRVRKTEVRKDTLWFCEGDDPIALNWNNVQRTPGNGTWTGAGITDPDNPGTFDPDNAGRGTHLLNYSANGCDAGIVMIVGAIPNISDDTIVCEITSPFMFTTDVPDGKWSGKGITDKNTGLFDPSVAGPGTRTIVYTSPAGCKASLKVEVDPLENVSISGLEPYYCYTRSDFDVITRPAGGTLSGPGITGTVFNPAAADTGTHMLTYTYGRGDCEQSDTFFVRVGEPLAVSTTAGRDSICPGDYTTLKATASGGTIVNVYTYQYFWNNGIGEGGSKPVNPSASTQYIVTVSDGCSDPVMDTVDIFVHPLFSATFETGAPKCYGDSGKATVVVNGNSNYNYLWDTEPAQSSDTVHALVSRTYSVTISDNKTGCRVNASVKIPGYENIVANFIPNPNNCASILDPTFSFIDLSQGVESGEWDFGDGITLPYAFKENPEHTYSDTGSYLVTLSVINEGGCTDTLQIRVCVLPEVKIFVPSIFTPNNDGRNDVFKALGEYINNFRLQVFNRWGEMLYETRDVNSGWDGTYKGEHVPNGAYVYFINYTTFTESHESKPHILKGNIIVLR